MNAVDKEGALRRVRQNIGKAQVALKDTEVDLFALSQEQDGAFADEVNEALEEVQSQLNEYAAWALRKANEIEVEQERAITQPEERAARRGPAIHGEGRW